MSRLVHFCLHGASCSGKGYVTNHLRGRYGDRLWVIGLGDMIRSRQGRDPEFQSYTDELIRRGFLISDTVVTEMVQQRYNEGVEAGFTTFLWEGYGRNQVQMQQQMEWWTGCEGRVFNLLARKSTVIGNLEQAIAENRRKDRGDNAAISDRYDLHQDKMEEVTRAVRDGGRFLTPIDANQPLEQVARRIAFFANAVRSFRESQGLPATAQLVAA
jgi:adenylate kinase family enzyme